MKRLIQKPLGAQMLTVLNLSSQSHITQGESSEGGTQLGTQQGAPSFGLEGEGFRGEGIFQLAHKGRELTQEAKNEKSEYLRYLSSICTEDC